MIIDTAISLMVLYASSSSEEISLKKKLKESTFCRTLNAMLTLRVMEPRSPLSLTLTVSRDLVNFLVISISISGFRSFSGIAVMPSNLSVPMSSSLICQES